MPRKKYSDLPLAEIMKKLQQSSLEQSKHIEKTILDIDEVNQTDSLQERVDKIIGIVNNKARKQTNMLFFVMYDIESDKVRTQIFKYLIREGCTRIQNSIFLADLPSDKYNKIREDLTAVQSCYENHDSILVVPISTDYLQAMKVIGKTIDVDIIMKTRNTLFF